jgi:hypothetical protein
VNSNYSDIDDRIRRALAAEADQVTEADLRPAQPPTTSTLRTGDLGSPSRWRWGAPLLAAAVVVAVAVGTTLLVHAGDSAKAPAAVSPSPTISNSGPQSSAPHPIPDKPGTTGAVVPPPASNGVSTAPPSTPANPATFDLGYEPLWPFASYPAAKSWRDNTGGHQPWHADAGQTALSFTQGYLGFTEVNLVTSRVTDSSGAHIGVGYRTPAGRQATASVLHLVRFGPDDSYPWEVVGSDDATFSVEQPAYGSAVNSPMTVGGHITGVDESIKVSVIGGPRGPGQLVASGMPAGGTNQPWTTGPVQFTATGVLTIVASTGGHLQTVERFAIQGVHT